MRTTWRISLSPPLHTHNTASYVRIEYTTGPPTSGSQVVRGSKITESLPHTVTPQRGATRCLGKVGWGIDRRYCGADRSYKSISSGGLPIKGPTFPTDLQITATTLNPFKVHYIKKRKTTFDVTSDCKHLNFILEFTKMRTCQM